MNVRRRISLLSLLGLLLLVSQLPGCAPLPSLEGRSVSSAMLDTAHTRLGQAIAPDVAAHPGASGVHALADAQDAFAARMLLAEAAEVSLDVQYYIWHADLTGTLLFHALYRAADRGVRVRLLLDDNNTAGLDEILAVLDAHANIEVRLFNPFVLRWPRWVGFVMDFPRLNRRMHNKSFTADSQATIVGGRNVGDEYFAATDDVVFSDLDALAVGPVVGDVARDFDRYWASRSAYPIGRLVPAPTAADREAFAVAVAQAEQNPEAAAYLSAVRESNGVRELLAGSSPMEWVSTRLVSDDPAKGLGKAGADTMLPHQLSELLGRPQVTLDLVSPYFVPTRTGTQYFTELADAGVRVRILINSLEATDVKVVHSGYIKRRRALLKAGVELYESRLVEPHVEEGRRGGPFGSSASSLHAKTFAVDRERVFIGSFNFDPRSARLNTEMGLVIESPRLAQMISTRFDVLVPRIAYRPRLSASGTLYWTEQNDSGTVRHAQEPGTGLCERVGVRFLSLLPIESLL